MTKICASFGLCVAVEDAGERGERGGPRGTNPLLGARRRSGYGTESNPK